MKPEEKHFRDWLKTNYGQQDFNNYSGTQTEELAIQFAKAQIASLEEKIVFYKIQLEKAEKKAEELKEQNEKLVSIISERLSTVKPEPKDEYENGYDFPCKPEQPTESQEELWNELYKKCISGNFFDLDAAKLFTITRK